MKYSQQDAKAMHDALIAADVKIRASWARMHYEETGDALHIVRDALASLEVTPVIFRKFKEGDVIAIFPAMAGDSNINTCGSYQHLGQHGACSIDLSRVARLATFAEYKDLKRELEGLGYRLKICRSIAPAHHAARRNELNR